MYCALWPLNSSQISYYRSRALASTQLLLYLYHPRPSSLETNNMYPFQPRTSQWELHFWPGKSSSRHKSKFRARPKRRRPVYSLTAEVLLLSPNLSSPPPIPCQAPRSMYRVGGFETMPQACLSTLLPSQKVRFPWCPQETIHLLIRVMSQLNLIPSIFSLSTLWTRESLRTCRLRWQFCLASLFDNQRANYRSFLVGNPHSVLISQ